MAVLLLHLQIDIEAAQDAKHIWGGQHRQFG